MTVSGRDLRVRGASSISIHPIRAAAIAAALLAGGCGEQGSPEEACADPSCSEETCPAPCGTTAAIGFEGPWLLWSGQEAEVPECPVGAERTVYLGYGDPDDAIQCPRCECTAPACELPAAFSTSTQLCPGGGPSPSTYPMPESWDGSCQTITPTPDPIESRQIAAITVRPCEPFAAHPVGEVAPASRWSTVAKACAGDRTDCKAGEMCPTHADLTARGFRECLAWRGDGEPACPASHLDKVTFYEEIDDTRTCSKCECTETAPAKCEAWVSIYWDNLCQDLFLGTKMGLGGEECGQGGNDIPIRSMDAYFLNDDAGTCTPHGGEPIGHADPLGPTHFCCQPLQ